MTTMVTTFLLRRRPAWALIVLAATLAGCYVAITFDSRFLISTARFWDNPVGPWLLDPTDTRINVDVAGMLAGYYAYAQAPWTYPLFFVPLLGPPPGTSGVFLDFIPIVALVGKLVSVATGTLVNPYGAWIVVAFMLSAVFATLVLIEAGEAHFLGCVIASLLTVSAAPLLHRFGHLALLGQFTLIAALWLYLRDGRSDAWHAVVTRWSILLCVTSLINAYLLMMVGAIYAASWIDHRLMKPADPISRWGEPALLAMVVTIVMVGSGYVGQGTTSPSGDYYGYFSMNLASPFWPQRSGLLPMMWPIVGRGGQYEGFNYLGAGGLTLLLLALVYDADLIRARTYTHPGFVAMAMICVLFALSNRVYLFSHLILYQPLPKELSALFGTFRSSGRFFWPLFYTIILGGITLALRRGTPAMKVAILILVCALQLFDTEPLRARITELTRLQTPMDIDRDAWIARLDRANAMMVSPSFSCGGKELRRINTELSLLSSLRGRPTNTVYDARAQPDCSAEARAAMNGPWHNDTLYVFLDAGGSRSSGLAARVLHCTPFRFGTWCLGTAREG